MADSKPRSFAFAKQKYDEPKDSNYNIFCYVINLILCCTKIPQKPEADPRG